MKLLKFIDDYNFHKKNNLNEGCHSILYTLTMNRYK